MQGKDIGKRLFGVIQSGCLTQVAALNRWLLKQVRLYRNLKEDYLRNISAKLGRNWHSIF